MHPNLKFTLSFALILSSFAYASKSVSCNVGSSIYKFKLGRWDAFVINDGKVSGFSAFFNVAQKVVLRSYQYYNGFNSELDGFVNVLVLRDANEVIVFDTGIGLIDLSGFGATGGQFMTLLKTAGIKPMDVTKVFITHAHPDHIGGLLGVNDTKAFPNANIYINRAENNFWLQPADQIAKLFPMLPPPIVTGTTASYARVNKAYGPEKIVLLNHGDRVGSVRILLTPGHTPGHSSYRIRVSRGVRHIVLGDSILTRTTSVQHPYWNFLFDANATLAVQTRYKLMDKISDGKTTAGIYHGAFPGIGYIVRDRDTFDFSALSVIPQI